MTSNFCRALWDCEMGRFGTAANLPALPAEVTSESRAGRCLRMGGDLGVLRAQQGSSHSDTPEDAEFLSSSCWAPSNARVTHPHPTDPPALHNSTKSRLWFVKGRRNLGNREEVGTRKNYRILNTKIPTTL